MFFVRYIWVMCVFSTFLGSVHAQEALVDQMVLVVKHKPKLISHVKKFSFLKHIIEEGLEISLDTQEFISTYYEKDFPIFTVSTSLYEWDEKVGDEQELLAVQKKSLDRIERFYGGHEALMNALVKMQFNEDLLQTFLKTYAKGLVFTNYLIIKPISEDEFQVWYEKNKQTPEISALTIDQAKEKMKSEYIKSDQVKQLNAWIQSKNITKFKIIPLKK